MSDDIVARLRLTPVLMYGDELGQSRIDYEACKKYINNEGVKMMREAAAEIERLRVERDGYLDGNRQTLAALAEANEIAKRYKAERDEARRLLKAVVDMMRDNMAHDATHPHHLCDFIHRPDIGMCKVCEDWTDAMVMCYPDDFQDEEDGK